MIVFLTLLYVGVLALAIKLGIVKPTLGWKLSPLAWALLLFLVLFLPMQWGAPSGTVNVIQYVVEVIPNVSGQVVEVPVEPMKQLRRGEVLFRIDPIPFQAKVDQLQAQLAAAIQNVEQLKAAAEAAAATVTETEEKIDVKEAEIEVALANIVVAETNVRQEEAAVSKFTSLVADLSVQVEAGNRELERQTKLRAEGAGSDSEVDQAKVRSTNLVSQFNSAEADLNAAEQSLAGSRAELVAAKANARRADVEMKQLVDAELPRTKAVAREAKLAAESMIGDEHTIVANVRAQLAAAQFDLDETTVRAPADGHVTYLTLRPGQRVANLPLRSWMAFVDDEKTETVVAIEQYALRHVVPGQKAEVTLKMYPGKVFNATVDRIAYTTSRGQVQPSGQIAPMSAAVSPEPYGVVLNIDDPSFEGLTSAGGAQGSAAIYTTSMEATHIIRRVMIRMDAWLNYVIP